MVMPACLPAAAGLAAVACRPTALVARPVRGPNGCPRQSFGGSPLITVANRRGPARFEPPTANRLHRLEVLDVEDFTEL